jgi:hypothetical protein
MPRFLEAILLSLLPFKSYKVGLLLKKTLAVAFDRIALLFIVLEEAIKQSTYDHVLVVGMVGMMVWIIKKEDDNDWNKNS